MPKVTGFVLRALFPGRGFEGRYILFYHGALSDDGLLGAGGSRVAFQDLRGQSWETPALTVGSPLHRLHQNVSVDPS